MSNNRNTPLLTVGICTYNNAKSLAETLICLEYNTYEEPGLIEIIIVDNNSSDKTESVVNDFQARFKGISRYVFETNQGLSHARNTLLKEARGTYILFTDDDATLPKNWIELYIKQIRETQADCLFSGIVVEWGDQKPWWYDDRYRAFFVELNYGGDRLLIDDIHHEFFGKNFAIRRAILLQMGGFDIRLGRKGRSLVAGEETVIYRDLIFNRKKVIYFPDAIVGHRLKPREHTEENIEKAFRDSAKTSQVIAKRFARKVIAGRPVGALSRSVFAFFKASVLWVTATLIGNRVDRFYQKLSIIRETELVKALIRND